MAGINTYIQYLDLLVTNTEYLLTSAVNNVVSVHSVSLLKNLKHANIVTLHDIIHTDRCLTLVFEYLVSALSMQGFGRC